MDDLINIRAEIARLQHERDDLLQWERNRAETAALLKREIDGWCTEGDALLSNRARLIAAGSMHASALLDAPLRHGEPHFAPIIAALLGSEAMTKALMDLAVAAVPAGPNAKAKAKRLAEIEVERMRLEHAEEDLIEASELAGNPIARRPGADPAIVLRVRE